MRFLHENAYNLMRFCTLDAIRYIHMDLNVCVFIRKRMSVDDTLISLHRVSECVLDRTKACFESFRAKLV